MTLAKRIEEVLKDELTPEDVKTVVDFAEFLKLKKDKLLWAKINEAEPEYISEEDKKYMNSLRPDGEFIEHEDVLKELGISEDEV